jgi:hypothetical protein
LPKCSRNSLRTRFAQTSFAVMMLVTPSTSYPLPEVQVVGDAVVGERGEAVLVDGVPEAELGGDPVVEPV